MFRVSLDSSQIDLLSNIEQLLRERDQAKLNDPNAWYNVFLDQVTKRIDEERFAELFDEEKGRPNALIRLLVAMLILKEGFGWSDEQLFEAIHINLLVRRALGLLNLTDEVPVESTYYLFTQRLYRYQVETGVDLLQAVFQELTRDQTKQLGVGGEKLRLDSTLLASHLASCTRLQLTMGCLQEFYKSLTDEQKARLNKADRALLDRLCAKRPSQIIYGLDETTKKGWLEDVGHLLLRLHQCYSAQSSPRYALIERLLLEQYQVDGEGEAQRVELKPAQQISAASLQWPHDEEATYRKKKDETVRGYSANVTETGQEKAEVPWQVSGPAVGGMPSRLDQHETHCGLSGETGRGDRLIEGLRHNITTQPLRSFIPRSPNTWQSHYSISGCGEIPSAHLVTCVSRSTAPLSGLAAGTGFSEGIQNCYFLVAIWRRYYPNNGLYTTIADLACGLISA